MLEVSSVHLLDEVCVGFAGSVWAWEDSAAEVAESVLQSDKTYVILLDGNAKAAIKVNTLLMLHTYSMLCTH